MSDLETENLEQPSSSAPFKAPSELEDVQKVCNSHMQSIYGSGEETEVMTEESEKPIAVSGETNTVNADKMPPNVLVDSMVQCVAGYLHFGAQFSSPRGLIT